MKYQFCWWTFNVHFSYKWIITYPTHAIVPSWNLNNECFSPQEIWTTGLWIRIFRRCGLIWKDVINYNGIFLLSHLPNMAYNATLTKKFTVLTFLWTAKQFVNCKLAAPKMLCNVLYMITFDSYYQTTYVLHFLSCLTKYQYNIIFQPLIFDLKYIYLCWI